MSVTRRAILGTAALGAAAQAFGLAIIAGY